MKPTYKTRFARCPAESAYPGLWRGLVATWAPLLGQSGGVLRDWAGRKLDGTMTNMDAGSDWIVDPGAPGPALNFDGSDDYIHVPHHTALSFDRTDHFAIEAVVRTATASPTSRVIVGKMQAANDLGYFLSINSLGNWTFALINNSAGGVNMLSARYAWTADTNWVHLLASYAGSSLTSGVSFYINGVIQTLASAIDTLTVGIVNTSPLNLGARVSGTMEFWSGDIALVRIYGHEISERRARRLARRPWLPFVRRDRDGASRLPAMPPGLVRSGEVVGAV